MRTRLVLVILIVTTLALAPLATASPAIHYLKDSELGPIDDGVLNQTTPTEANGTTRVIPALPGDVYHVVFAAPDDEIHEERLRGTVFAGLWIDKSVVAHGNITAALILNNANGSVAIANATAALDVDPEDVPDPLTLVPPEPTDVEGSAYYVAAQLMPVILTPPMVLNFGPVDVPVDNETWLSIALRFDPGSSPAPGAVGVGATLQYDGTLTPSYLYAPWYTTPPPPPPAPDPEPTPEPSPTNTTPATGSDDGGDAPAPLLPLILLAVLLAAALRRRR